ncbi:MAG: HAMP domain-containing sensor histidine kinase [Pseudomonadota bacterium]
MDLRGVRLPPFARTTTFRLSLLYVGLIVLTSALLFGLLYQTTVGYLNQQTEERVDEEIGTLLLGYREGGLSRVTQALFERAATPNRYFLYQLETPSGIKLDGDLSDMPPHDGPGKVEFEIDVRRPGGDIDTLDIKGQIVALGTEARLLVGYDSSETELMIQRIMRAINTAALVGFIITLLGGWYISRDVSRRAAELVATAEAIKRGNLDERARVGRYNDEFDQLAERMNAMLDRLQKLVRASRHTGDAIAHDLRSPLSRMRNRLEDELLKPDLNPQAVLVQTISEVDGILATFNAILRLSHLDAQTKLSLVNTDIAEVVDELADLFEPAAEDQGLAFQTEKSRAPQVLGDREMIAQAVANLIDNAIKYTPEGGAISVSTKRADSNMVDVVVKDTGLGIPEADRERAKQRFERLDEARTHQGSGLGLALVDAVAEVHRGEFILLDGDGPPERPGLRAILRLPRA